MISLKNHREVTEFLHGNGLVSFSKDILDQVEYLMTGEGKGQNPAWIASQLMSEPRFFHGWSAAFASLVEDGTFEPIQGVDATDAFICEHLLYAFASKYIDERFLIKPVNFAALGDENDDGPKLSDPLGNPPISTSKFFQTYKTKHH